MSQDPVFIGGAWPYANGRLHLGHLAGLLPGDVLARYYRQKGHPVLYVAGTDCHGTPIALRAEQEGTSPAEIVARYHAEFSETFAAAGFTYDVYWHTDHPAHHRRVREVFRRLRASGWLYERVEAQPFCPQEERFLPDRYVEGRCRVCGTRGARGDQCDACGSLLSPDDLADPRCRCCGAAPVLRETRHLYFRLSELAEPLQQLLETGRGRWRENAIRLTERYLQEGLRDRAATRDLAWGVDAPFDDLPAKKIYVWFDAVLGYLTASEEWAARQGDPEAWRRFWRVPVRSYYVHGKDNIAFHTLLLPGLLAALGETEGLPGQIVSSEHLTLEGKPFSTSRDRAVWAGEFLRHYQPDALRYYLLANGPEGRDSDFSWSEFVRRTNDELLGAYGNLIHRIFSLIWRQLGGAVPPLCEPDARAREELTAWQEAYSQVGVLLERGELKRAIQSLFERIRAANRTVDQIAPWRLRQQRPEAGRQAVALSLHLAANAAQLALPFLPGSAGAALRSLGVIRPGWQLLEFPAGARLHACPEPLIRRLDVSVVEEERGRLSTRSADG
jgi:methionyl-tRNA synthetase